MKFKSKIYINEESPLWGGQIKVPPKVADHFHKKLKIKRVIITIEKMISYHAALMPAGDGTFFINVNKEVRKKLQKEFGDELSIELKEDDSKYGMHCPEEFEELLLQDEEGEKLFHALTPGRQRSLLHLIGKPKSEEIRLRKGLVVLMHLKTNKGLLDFKMLNQAFKDNKNRDLNDWFS